MFDLEKANICAKEMKKYFSNYEQDADVLMPEEIDVGSQDYITYIFYSCLLDYGMRSRIYHANLVNTYRRYPRIFNPQYVTQEYLDNEEELLSIIKNNIHPRYPNVAVKKWLELSKFLNSNYRDTSILDGIKQLDSYKELYSFINSIKGYGQKTGGLLLRLIYEADVCSFNGEIEDIPIDRHDVEISYLNGIVNKKDLKERELKELGTIWINAAKMNGVRPSDIDKYLWTIGNRMCLKKKCEECPLSKNCQKKQ